MNHLNDLHNKTNHPTSGDLRRQATADRGATDFDIIFSPCSNSFEPWLVHWGWDGLAINLLPTTNLCLQNNLCPRLMPHSFFQCTPRLVSYPIGRLPDPQSVKYFACFLLHFTKSLCWGVNDVFVSAWWDDIGCVSEPGISGLMSHVCV